jgi:protein O-GlcNAc transferase
LRANDAVGRSTAEQLLENALAAQRRGSIADAKRLYASLLNIDPANAAAYGNLAIIAAHEGDLAMAERLFREGIRLGPADPAGHNNLGSVLQQQGRLAEAIAAHRQAIKLNPNYAEAYLVLGNALRQQGNFEEAMTAYRSAIKARRDYPEAHNNAGVLLQMLGRLEEAASAYRDAVALRPAYAEAVFNLGVVLHQMHELDAAETAYRRVIGLSPAIAVVHNNLGTVLKDRGQLDQALAAFEKAIELKPDYAEAFYNRATVLQQQARLEDALTAYGQAIGLRKDYADAINNAGIVLQELGRAGDAVELYRQLLQRMPVHADACNNMGTALLAEGRADEAQAAFEQALAHRPDFPEAVYNLGNARRELGDLAGAIAAYRNALQLRPDYADAFSQLAHHRALACEWSDYEADQARLVEMVRRGDRVPPFYLLSTQASASDQLICAQRWIGPIKPPKAVYKHEVSARRERIRLGYLSGDFHQHATAQLMAELFELHGRDRFEIFAYSYGPDDRSPMRARLDRAFDRFVDIGALSHREAAQRIHADKVDILVDLKGYTYHARPAISAYRPAPVQVSYLGYPATMGADFIDYIIVDPVVVPASQQPFFSEQLVHLPGSYQVNDRRREVASARTSRQDWGLPEAGLVFCSFNNSYKISPAFFDIWMRLLRSEPASVLWLLEANELVKGNLRSEAKNRGVEANRLIFAPRVASAEHLGRHRHADLFLDTLPCNAHTTASDALWAGLPVLTCHGDTFAGRVAASLLTAVGMRELIAASMEEYERTALALARDLQRLTALRQKLADNRDASALFDPLKLTGNIEAAYARMWQAWLSGRKPEPFAIENA